MLSAPALKPEESSWKQQSSTGPPCLNSPRSTLALASYSRTVCAIRERGYREIERRGIRGDIYESEGIPCPMKRRANDRCGWRSGG